MQFGFARAGRAVIVAALLTVAFGVWPASAKEAKGTLCRVREVQVINPGTAMIRENLWKYTGEKAPYDPVFGWVEAACADRGVARSPNQDLGRRIWFNVAGAKGAPADKAKLSLDDQQTRAEGNTLGITVDGLTLRGEVSPDHACIFVVSVWMDSCPTQ